MEEQLDRLGHIYWPQRFTLPYVTACTTHGLSLQEVPASSCIRLGKAKYLGFPSDETARTAPRLPAGSIQIQLSTLAADLVDAQMESVPPSVLTQAYLLGLQAKGLAAPTCRVKRLALWDALRQRWGSLGELRVGAGRVFPAWLTQLYAPAGPLVRCPVYHLLLIGLLFESVAAWREKLRDSISLEQRTDTISSRSRAHQAPVAGTKFVQLRHWLERSRCGPDEPRLAADAIQLLESGQPMHEVVAASGVGRNQLYRALRRSPQLAQARALAALASESQRRMVPRKPLSSVDARPELAASKADRKWTYRHTSALELLCSSRQAAPK